MKMKKLTTALSIALIVLGNLPVFATANIASTTETTNTITTAATSWCCYRIAGYDTRDFNLFVNRGHADILIVGDGSTDLDLYVYIGGDWEVSDNYGDDEKVCLPRITRSGYITVRVVNRGRYTNNYQLIIK